MSFRKDLNGLRAIAVIAVVIFHFNENWMPGGFSGVDVFFVISGFLMTGIIFEGFRRNNFSVLNFYVARANRIIPALAVLCLVLLVFGWFFLTPLDYRTLGKHVGSSMVFLSNITYWRESGYFDAASHEKWLLHTWSLSAEWQFYIIYPLALVAMKKIMSLRVMRTTILVGAVLGFLFSVMVSYKWPNPAYYLLPTRSWEMMIGGIAYLYPLRIKNNNKKYFELIGLLLIVVSYFLISKENIWPGYLAVLPVFGTFLVIQAQRNDSILTGNFIFQLLGRWSYSIYLWHWPFVVAIYYFKLSEVFIFYGIFISVFLGFLSSKYIEVVKFRNDFSGLMQYLRCKPVWFSSIVFLLGFCVFLNDGFIKYSPVGYQELIGKSIPSPLRDKCHVSSYQDPSTSCEYFGRNVSWAVFGDSHTVEIAYSLAKKLEGKEEGLKHFSFSGCRPSYKKPDSFNECSKWYNESIAYIVNDESLKNIVFNHRFTSGILGGDASGYPDEYNFDISDESLSFIESIDELIFLLASIKNKVYVFYPIPELPKPIHRLVGDKLRNGGELKNVVGTDLDWYRNRNKYIIQHFKKTKYPKNVIFINPEDSFCDNNSCYAVLNGVPLYFDDDHPSIYGANKLVDRISVSD